MYTYNAMFRNKSVRQKIKKNTGLLETPTEQEFVPNGDCGMEVCVNLLTHY